MIGYGNSVFLRTAWEVSSGGTPPANTVAPVISGTQVVGSTLTSTTGTWTGIPAPTFTYQWFRGATLIVGATSSTYVLVQADAGNTSNITCKMTGTNAFGNATATSNTLAQIFDFDANAFITSAVITDTTQKAATNSLTIDLKGYNVWSKMKAIYPMVGGTNAKHTWNLKNTAQFQISWVGGTTSSVNGVQFNGMNSYGNTGFNISTQTNLNDFHFSFYSRVHSAVNSIDIGASTDSVLNYYIIQCTGTTTYNIINESSSAGTFPNFADNNTRGLYLGTRNGTVVNAWKSGVKKATKSPATTAARPNQPVFIGAWNALGIASLYSAKQLAFSSIGDGLTDTEAANFYTAVQAFQTTLGRQV